MENQFVGWDMTTPYAAKFKVEGKKVTLIKDDGLFGGYQLTTSLPLPKNKTSTTTFRIKDYAENYMCMGIIT